jgi:hypothetical protein
MGQSCNIYSGCLRAILYYRNCIKGTRVMATIERQKYETRREKWGRGLANYWRVGSSLWNVAMSGTVYISYSDSQQVFDGQREPEV